METAICRICKQEKPLSEFQRRPNRKGVLVVRRRCRPCASMQHSDWQHRTGDRYRNYRRDYWREMKTQVIEMYGAMCECCGEGTIEFLGIDHIDGGGWKHRKSLGGQAQFYRWLLQQKREGFRVLCNNCNLSYGFYGYCPHKPHTQAAPLVIRRRWRYPVEKVDEFALPA